MVTFHLSHTSPINPPSATPILTQAQIWAGLQRKIRFAQEFVPVIESCHVLREEKGEEGDDQGTVVTREVKLKEGMGAKKSAKEIVRGFWPSWVDFEQEDGSHIRNVVSSGSSGEEEDLYMTYSFEFRFPNLTQGSPEAEKELQRLKGMAKNAVESSIDAMRAMVTDGRIEA